MKLDKKALRTIITLSALVAVIGLLWAVKNYKPARRSKNESLASGQQSALNGPQAKEASSLVAGPLGLSSAFDLEALRSTGLPLMIDFGADSCIPCKQMAPVMEELHASLQGRVIIRFIDVWKYRDLANGYPIQVIPTQLFFDAQGRPFSPPQSLGIPFNQYSLRDTNEHVFTTHEGGLDKAQMLSIFSAMGMK